MHIWAVKLVNEPTFVEQIQLTLPLLSCATECFGYSIIHFEFIYMFLQFLSALFRRSGLVDCPAYEAAGFPRQFCLTSTTSSLIVFLR